jgi:hypothetical protein
VIRRLFNVLAVVSLALCVAATVLWISSYARGVGVFLLGERKAYGLSWNWGVGTATARQFATPRHPTKSFDWASGSAHLPYPPLGDVRWSILGITLQTLDIPSSHETYLDAPLWIFSIVFCILPGLWLRKRMKKPPT